ncbi:MAG: molybdenum cofactor biosynthesis protein MoaE [Alphaproteobacteria bacterium]|nr:molybdenum cofactor biosynthesis protein MoaE [Alphaproteobacteria bacterium]MBV9061838.1 molybdenum cofactor biosynthesis protein MoaE [Alphaproteobacteria bacterium]
MSTRISIQRVDFDLSSEVTALKTSAVGAIVIFTGTVRGDDGLSSLILEHYPGMTEREIARHVEEANGRWPLLGVTVIHRIGKLTTGENIVLVGVASAHRQAAFEAAEFLMDYLKTRAPFWKSEERHGSARWVEARGSDDAALSRWRRAD